MEGVPKRLRLPLVTVEQTAHRVGQTSITWGDVDVDGLRFRLRARRAKSKRGKWVPVPLWLMDVLTETCPVEDRLAGAAVFQGVTDAQLRGAMARACKLAGIPSYSPHDLRHRRIALWHYAGVPLRDPGARRAFVGFHHHPGHVYARDASRRARPGGVARFF